MATRYLIGNGEKLTMPVKVKRGPSPKARPYSLGEAVSVLVPQIDATNQHFATLPDAACPDDLAVARVTLHPTFIAKSFFPDALLKEAGIASVGSRNVRIRPRKKAPPTAPDEADTTELFVAGQRSKLRVFSEFAQHISDGTKLAEQISEIEQIVPLLAQDRIKAAQADNHHVFEVGLHLPPKWIPNHIQEQFTAYAESCGFHVHPQLHFESGKLLFLAIEGDPAGLEQLARFTMMRVIRPMPKLRGFRPVMRSGIPGAAFGLPAEDPWSREPKVAILDGGLPAHHVLGDYVRHSFVSDTAAHAVQDYLEHGLAVTSAFLFGPVMPGHEAQRPFSQVDHHRVLDALSNEEDPYTLYRTLAHIQDVLRSRTYQFINLSLGPEVSVEDDDVHAWSAVIDEALDDGNVLMTVAAGNNGEGDAQLGLNRIQVPSDCVNAVTVGASDSSTIEWARASYSAVGPGRSPGRRKPDVLAFGGSHKEYFHVAEPGMVATAVPQRGTSFAAPLVLRMGVGVRAILGPEVNPLTIKALLVHSAERGEEHPDHVGWGRVPSDVNALITTEDGEARIIYQGVLEPGKYLRAPIPIPAHQLQGMVTIKATFCYASQLAPEDSSAYTKAGLEPFFRPHSGKKNIDKKTGKESEHAKTGSFFRRNEFMTEQEQRDDVHKWETVLHAEDRLQGRSLKNPVIDIHYNAREGCGNANSADRIPYALVVTVKADKHPMLHDEILAAHSKLKALAPQVHVQLGGK